MVFLYILLFILFLSILIVVHEAGHLTAAKIFKVYCLDFSIGFGPAFFHKKRKNGETYFSLRCIPFGGFVSMYGEGVELPDGQEVPITRSLEGIRKWKQAIIMAAGVFMNVILAIVIFFISNQACVHYTYYLRLVDPIKENTLAYNAGMVVDNDNLLYNSPVLTSSGESTTCYQFDLTDATITYSDGSSLTDVSYVLDTSAFTMDKRDYEDICGFYETYMYQPKEGEPQKMANLAKPISLAGDNNKKVTSVSFTICTCPMIDDPNTGSKKFDDDDPAKIKHYRFENVAISQDTHKFETPLGLTMLREDEWYSFPKAFNQTFVDFADASSALFRGLGTLFTPDGWKQVGGIVAIGVMTSNTLANQGIARFLYIWGFISINLAIVNLLPFPGLDGWQLVVLGVEGVTRKKIPTKVKSIVSFVGIALLFVLMILIIVKDIIMLI